MEVKRIGLDEWEEVLPDRGIEPFHAPAALEVLDRHSSMDLQLFAGYKGQHPVALLPVFVEERSMGRAVISPPPSMGVHRLGPILMPNSPKRRKQEKVNKRFVEGVLDDLDADSRLTFVRLSCSTWYTDPRPFIWDEFQITPAFTYQIDLDRHTLEEIRRSFSKDLRKDIKEAKELDITVRVGGVEEARKIHGAIRQRYEEQNKRFNLDWMYIRDLVTELDDRCRIYVVESPEGEFLNGLIVLYSNDAAYSWQGGTAASYESVSVNSPLQWRIIEDVVADPPFDSVDTYDLSGANTERLCRYKSAFGGELIPYYVIESSGQAMEMAKKAYQFISG